MVPATRSWRGWVWLLVAAVATAVLLLRSSVWVLGPAWRPALSNEKGLVEMTTTSPWFNATVTTTDEPSPCGRLLLDNWAKGQNFKVVLLSIETEGAFGNELFIVAKALVEAQRLQYPVLLTRPSRKRQILQLPCLRSSLGLQRAAEEMCPGCSSEKFWDDRSKACNRGYGCLELLRKQKRVMDPGAGGFHQDLGEWKEPPLSWRPLLAEAFQVDMPMKTDVPGDADLVMYFRAYRRKQIFDLRGDHAFLTSPPFAFFDFAVQQHRRDFPSGKLVVIAEPSMRSHPTVARLRSELGAQVVTDMDQAGKHAWLADWVWLRSAKHLVLSPSTFVWWAAFLSEALRIYVPIFPGIAALPWCKLLPSGDPRYLFYDFWTNTTFTDGSVAKTHCQEYFHCKADECVVKKHRTAMASLYPELLELNQQDADFLNASAAKMGAPS